MKNRTITGGRPGNMMAVAVLLALSMVTFGVSAEPAASSLAVKNGDKIVFIGDSITAGGAKKDGYVTLVMETLKAEGLDVSHVPAGKSGNKSSDMLARLDADVISKAPQWMVLSCGVNDVWHFKLRLGNRTFEGVSLEDYKKNITEIIDKAQAANIKVMVLTSTMIGEDPERELNKNLIPYNEFLRKIAKDKNCLLADLNKDMQEALKKIPDVKGAATMFGEPGYKRDIKNKLTSDGCHMNSLGNMMMAKGVLSAFGMGEEKIAAAEKAWLDRK
jgi:lysophospholipase L1-like esterase